ncbi:glycosyltransferase family 2 protein [Grimontia hollisae]|uniref:glycosyltransferase family 2 protein n=1 Tax=Grimontia hollisae TaxID=673 RepID=UPI0012AC93C2|nr:glycosyltransferase [Grimontia hollisae]
MKVSVAIVTYNRKAQLARALKSCVSCVDSIKEIVVVDNFSCDGTSAYLDDIVRLFQVPIKVIRMHKNIGCPRARNIAIANCTSRYVYCLDDDGWLDKNALTTSTKLIMEEKVAVVVSRIVAPKCQSELGYTGTTRKVGKFSGGASLIDRKYFERFGGFPDFFRQMEETYLSLIYLNNGLDIIFNSDSIMYHEKSKTKTQSIEEIRYNYLNEMKTLCDLISRRWFFPLMLGKTMSHSRLYIRKRCYYFFMKDILSSILLPFVENKELGKNRQRIKIDVLAQQRKLK